MNLKRSRKENWQQPKGRRRGWKLENRTPGSGLQIAIQQILHFRCSSCIWASVQFAPHTTWAFSVRKAVM